MTFQIILDFISFFVMGLSVGFMVCERFIIRGLKRQLDEAMEGWAESVKQHLDLIIQIARTVSGSNSGLDVQEDGSAKSPFPITNFKKDNE